MQLYLPKKPIGRLALRLCVSSPRAFRAYIAYRHVMTSWPFRFLNKVFDMIWSFTFDLLFSLILASRPMVHALQAGLFTLGFFACAFYAFLAAASRSPLYVKMDVIL